MAVNVLKTVKHIRENYPKAVGMMTDDELVDQLMSRYPDEDWGEYSVPDEVSPTATEFENIDDSPGAIGSLMTMNLNDALAGEYDWAKRSYNNSLSGNIYKMMYGRNKYKVEEIPNEWYQDALGFFLAMANPLEVGLFVGTMGAGTLAAQPAKAAFNKAAVEGLKLLGKKKAKDKVFSSYLLKSGAVEGALGLGTYSAAATAIHGYGQQSVDIAEGRLDEYDDSKIWGDASKSFVSGSILGAMGGIVKTPMATKFATSSKQIQKLKATGANVPSTLAARKILNSPVGQVLAESQAFTLGQTIEEGVLSGEMPSMDDWWRKTFHNVAIIGGLRGGSKIIKTVFQGDYSTDVERYYAAKKKMFTESYGPQGKYQKRKFDTKQKELLEKGINFEEVEAMATKRGVPIKQVVDELNALNKVIENLNAADIPIPKEVLDRIAEIEAESFFAKEESNIVRQKAKRLDELINKSKDEETGELDLNKLTEQEQGEFGKLSTEMNLWKLDFYETLKNEPDIAREMFKDAVGKEPTEIQDVLIEQIIEGRIKDHVKVSELFNESVGRKTKKQLEEVPTEKLVDETIEKPIEEIKSDIDGTPEQQVKFWEEAVDNIKSVLKYTTSESEKQNLQSQLKEELMQLSEAKKKIVEKPVEKPTEKSKPTKEDPVDLMNENQLVAEYSRIRGISPKEARKELTLTMEKDGKKVDIFDEASAKDYIKSEREAEGRGREGLVEDIAKRLGLADKEKAKAKIKKLEDTDIKDLKGKDKGAKLLLERQKLDKKNKNYVEPLSEETNSILVDYLVNNNKKTSSSATTIVNLLKSAGKRELKDITFSDINKFVKNWAKTHNTINTQLTDIQNILSHANARGLLLKMPSGWTKQKYTKLWNQANEMLKLRGKEIKEAIGAIIAEFGSYDDAVKFISSKLKGADLESNIGARIHLKEGFGLRTQEVNKLNPEHLIKDGDYYALNLTRDVAKSNAREVPITKALYNDIIKLIAEKGIEKGQQIFSGGTPSKILSITGLGKKLLEKGVPQKLELFARKLAESTLLARTGLTEYGKTFLKGLMGHESWSDKVYGVAASKKQLREMNKNARDFMDGKIDGKTFEKNNLDILEKVQEKRAERVEGETIFKGKEADAARKEFIIKALAKNGLTKKQIKEAGLDPGVLGEFAEGIIKLAKGEWQPSDFYHENLHRLKAFGKLTNDTALNKIISRAEKLAGKTKEYNEWLKIGKNKERGKNKSENIEEFLADIVGGKASKMEFTKGMLPKIKQVVKQLVSRVKTALGVGNFNDLSRVLAGKVRKGFKTEGVKFGKEVKQRKLVEKLGLEESRAKSFGRKINKDLTKTLEEANMGELKNKVIKWIAEGAGITDKNFKLGKRKIEDPVQHYENLKMFEAELKELNLPKLNRFKRIETKKEWFKSFKDINIRRLETNITEASQKTILESFGVKDGNIWNASLDQIKEYRNLLHNLKVEERKLPSWVSKDVADKLAYSGSDVYDKMYQLVHGEIPKILYPVYKVLEKMGLKPLSRMLKSHFSAEAGHLGIGHDLLLSDLIYGWKSRIDNNGTKLPKGKEIQVKGLGQRGFSKIQDLLWSADYKGERLLENLEILKKSPEKLTKTQRKEIKDAEAFFRKAIKKEWFLLEKPGNLKDYINYSTPEGRVIERHVQAMKYFSDKIKDILRIQLNDAQYEKFMKQGNIDFITDGIFLTRQVTKEYKKIAALDIKEVQKIIDDNTHTIADELARKKYNTDKPTNEQINSVLPDAKTKALEDLYDANNFALDKLSSKFLLKRHTKLPEFIQDPNNPNKLIRVYETSFDNTTVRYSIGMSKFLATLEFFPEFTNLKGFKTSGAKKQLAQLKETAPESFDWINDSFNARVGIGKANPFEVLTGAMQISANILAKVGLSGPTSGFKNIVTGTVGTLYAMNLSDMGRSFANIIRGEGRETTKVGHESLGMQHYREGKVTEFFDKYAFRFGLMKPTEKFNRQLSILAGKYDQRRMFDTLKSSKKGELAYDRAYERLNDFYELSPEQIRLVKKYGFNVENVRKGDFQSTRQHVIEKRNLENAIQKMNTMSHVKTQGSSADIFMPKWASENYIRPLTLYKRMAFAATVNTFENVNRAWKSGDYSKILVGTAGTYLGGASLLAVYSAILGQPMPGENDVWWKKVMTTMWKGEFLGILSEYFSPYDSSMANTIHPAMIDNFGALLFNVSSVITDKKDIWGRGQALDTYARRTVNLFNIGQKVYEKRLSPYNKDMTRYKQLYKDFIEEVRPGEQHAIQIEGNELSKYKTYLRNSFNLGTDEEFVKSYMVLRYALASQYMANYYAEGPKGKVVETILNTDAALKKADKKLKTMITNLNPNPASMRKGQKLDTRIRKTEFLDWLGRADESITGLHFPYEGRSHKKRLKELEDEYNAKIARLKGGAFHYQLRKLNMKKIAKDVNFPPR